jgi:hypothetical protein
MAYFLVFTSDSSTPRAFRLSRRLPGIWEMMKADSSMSGRLALYCTKDLAMCLGVSALG